MKKFGKVAIVGAPNAGKSTLLNYLIGEKLAIVSPKAQTTRNILRGVFIKDDTQILFIDTPGLFSPTKKLEKVIVKNAWIGINEANYVLVIIDATSPKFARLGDVIDHLKRDNIKASIVINKIDLVKKGALLELISKLSAYEIFEEFFLVSAKTGQKVDELVDFIITKMPKCEWEFTEDEITDAPTKYLLSEFTREQLFLNLGRELPYAVSVETETLETFDNGNLKIQQVIYVTKPSQKSIVIGKQGQMIKKIGEEARKQMSKLMHRKVHLYLFVKIKENWVDLPDLSV